MRFVKNDFHRGGGAVIGFARWFATRFSPQFSVRQSLAADGPVGCGVASGEEEDGAPDRRPETFCCGSRWAQGKERLVERMDLSGMGQMGSGWAREEAFGRVVGPPGLGTRRQAWQGGGTRGRGGGPVGCGLVTSGWAKGGRMSLRDVC